MGALQDWVFPLSVLALSAAALGVFMNGGDGPVVVVTTTPSSRGFGPATAMFFLGIVLFVLVIFAPA